MLAKSNKLSPQRETYVDKIVEIVEERILSGIIPPESKISEGQLAKEFSVSRGPAREALNRLEEMGLIEKNDSGRSIKAFDLTNYRETYELRIIVEAYCAMQAAEKSTDQDHKILRDLIDQMEKNLSPANQAKLEKLVIRFHDFIVECSRNETLIEVYQSAQKKIRWANNVVLKFRDLKVDFAEHCGIADMVINRKTEKARSLMEHHSTTNMGLMIRAFEKKKKR